MKSTHLLGLLFLSAFLVSVLPANAMFIGGGNDFNPGAQQILNTINTYSDAGLTYGVLTSNGYSPITNVFLKLNLTGSTFTYVPSPGNMDAIAFWVALSPYNVSNVKNIENSFAQAGILILEQPNGQLSYSLFFGEFNLGQTLIFNSTPPYSITSNIMSVAMTNFGNGTVKVVFNVNNKYVVWYEPWKYSSKTALSVDVIQEDPIFMTSQTTADQYPLPLISTSVNTTGNLFYFTYIYSGTKYTGPSNNPPSNATIQIDQYLLNGKGNYVNNGVTVTNYNIIYMQVSTANPVGSYWTYGYEFDNTANGQITFGL